MNKFINLCFLGMFFSCLFFLNDSISQDKNPVLISVSEVKEIENNFYEVNFLFNAKEGWHVYAHDELENGLPMQINSENSNVVIKEIAWPKSFEEETELNDLKINTKFYKDSFIIPVRFSLNYGSDAVFKVELGACNEICIAQSEKINVKTKPNCVICDFLFYGMLALLGGFILNFMPCVLPVISMKIFSLASAQREKTKESAIFTILGVVFSFIIIAIITVFLKNVGESVGWGLHFQSSNFVIFLTFLMMLFAYNLNGDFEVLVNNNGFNFIEKYGNKTKNFLVGATATLLATPCTAPFLAAAVGFAITKSAFIIFYIYIMLGIGMSLPFIAVALHPSLIKFIPKPGQWMIKLKKLFASLFLLTAFWLIYILYFQINLNGLIGLVLMMLLLKFILRFQIIYERLHRLLLLIIVTLACIYAMVWHFDKEQKQYESIYSENWQEYSDEALSEHVSKNHIIFVDVTAEWCVTCKINKLTTLGNEDVILFLKKNNVIMLRADVTNSNESVKNLMKKHDRFGVPLNLIYSPKLPNGYVLPHILTPNLIYQAIAKS